MDLPRGRIGRFGLEPALRCSKQEPPLSATFSCSQWSPTTQAPCGTGRPVTQSITVMPNAPTPPNRPRTPCGGVSNHVTSAQGRISTPGHTPLLNALAIGQNMAFLVDLDGRDKLVLATAGPGE